MLEIIKAEKIMDEKILAIQKWYEFRNVLPLIQKIKLASENYVAQKIDHTLAGLKEASPKEKEKIKKAMQSLASHLLNKYIYKIKEGTSGDEADTYLKCLSKPRSRED